MRSPAVIAMIVALGAAAACSSAPPPPTPEQIFQTSAASIDPQLTNGANALAVGRSVCAKLAQGQTIDDVARATQRLTGGESLIGADQSRKLVEAAKRTLCP